VALVVVAPTAHRAADRAQYPKDHSQDDQDATDYPKDGAAENKREDDQDDAKSDQRVPPQIRGLVGIPTLFIAAANYRRTYCFWVTSR
jgi:hypothetical protein